MSLSKHTAIIAQLMLGFAVFASNADAQTPRRPQALTDAQRQSAVRQGSTTGSEAATAADANLPEFEAGATEDAAGRIKVNGQWYESDKVTGGSYEEGKATKAKSVTADGNMDDLRTLHDEEQAEIKAEGEGTLRGKAYGAAWESQDKQQDGKRIVEETNWDTSNEAIADAREGRVLGQTLADCQTTTTVIPGTLETTVKDQEVCERVVQPGAGNNGTVCTRDRNCTSSRPSSSAERAAELNISTEQSHAVCTRTTQTEEYINDLSLSRTGLLAITTETGGLSCSRTVWPETSSTTSATSQDATLSVDTQAGGNLCTREAYPTDTSTGGNGSQSATLSVDNQTPAQVCTRTRTASGGAPNQVSGTMDTGPLYYSGTGPRSYNLQPYVPAGTTEISNVQITMIDSNGPVYCLSYSIASLPTSANNFVLTLNTTASTAGACGGSVMRNFRITWVASVASAPTFGLTETGNCSDAGTPNCPTSWTCTANAPTTINGIAVSAAQAAALGALYPGAPNTCVSAALNRTCGGTASNNNSISIAASLPAGTASISGFGFAVTNPQAGVNVVLTQTPSAANNWVAVFRVDRTNWATTPANPQINMTWNMQVPGVSMSQRDTGSCAATGTTNCPATWTCQTSAPTTINGITVTAAMAAQVAPLFPGASSSCARARLDRVCNGSAPIDTSVSLAARMPAGTTAISNLQFTVLNPQSGVTVTMIQTPTLANNWVAIYRAVRTTWATQPAQPNIRITWNATHPVTNVSVRDTGNCADPGSAACPTVWSCATSAPATVNGIVVSAAMAGTQAPLFPGASSSCVVGNLTRVCSGSSSTITSIGIGDLLPAGTTVIRNFGWTWNNQDPALTVVLTAPPTLANGWAAQFRVTRNYAGGSTPPQPSVTLNWNVDSEIQYRAVIDEDGDCEAAEDSANCPVVWACTTQGPGMVDGVMVTQAMLNERGPLYPADQPPTCLNATRSNVCTGDGAVLTEVRLDDLIPDWVQTIQNYTWQVTIAGAGIAVEQVQAPSKENNWRAIFRTTRSDWSIPPTKPTVTLTWQMEGELVYTCEVTDTGDCNTQSDEFCDAEWVCTEEAVDPPADPQPVLLSHVQTQPMLFAYATSGNPYNSVATFPASLVPAGTVSFANFTYAVVSQVGTGSCSAAVTGRPAPGNLQTNVTITRGSTGGGGGPGGGWTPHVPVEMAIIEQQEPLEVRFASAVMDALIPSANAQAAGCGLNIVFSWDNMGLDGPVPDAEGPFGPDLEGEPPLFDGDGGQCMQAERRLECGQIWVGEECDINSEGVEYCVNQPPTDGPPDTCGELEANPNCELVREECSEGGMSASGWCYVRSYLYECSRTVMVDNPTINEETVCSAGEAGMPPVCLDGTCVDETRIDREAADIATPGAKMMIIQHQMKDFEVQNTSPGGGGNTGGHGDIEVPVANP